MVPVTLSRLQSSRLDAIEDWPWLDQDVLCSSRSRQVCMTCHFFRHHPGPNGIPLLTCHLHQGLIACSGVSGGTRNRPTSEKRQQGWQACPPQCAHPCERQPRDDVPASSMGRSASSPCF
jgi:hypothetical protein